MKGDTVPAPREAPGATPRTTPSPRSHGGDRVFTPEFDTVAHDHLDPAKRYHTGIFVERDPEIGLGDLFNVTGDIIARAGMRFEVKEDYVPGADRYFHRTEQVGWIHKADYPRITRILEALPTPTKQQGLDFWSKDPAKRNISLLGRSRTEIFTGRAKNDGQS
ncbi:hypothetical protein N7468_004836 [Penicillium chermesinum]|uniref:Uncharacterized protein n=1 Tax=Penicillium chermesinum TaxID=63820 RepID=A0A9W9TT43_9EURO|nr:uncharacterized protein N7468_004836 [Penicillium chermesinum]KAJ5240217.1 hypothetical protein N7468_004836 [Penicillium chermesinum]